MNEDYCEVIITAGNAAWLPDFTRSLVDARLAACGQNIAGIWSIYRPAARPPSLVAAGQPAQHHRHERVPVAHGPGDHRGRDSLPRRGDAAASRRKRAVVALRPAWLALLTAVLVPLTAAVMWAERPLRPLPAGVGPPRSWSPAILTAGVTAAELMSAPPVTIGADASVAEAARLMYDRGVKRLPVVDGDGPLPVSSQTPSATPKASSACGTGSITPPRTSQRPPGDSGGSRGHVQIPGTIPRERGD
jgi:CBS domain